ncbi:hypothetical protein HZC07_04475, partial [Candidatus Micrarchaeota archaeon]|nr:hypothetical protein [Candidatus Micrarchaeota archaeon]
MDKKILLIGAIILFVIVACGILTVLLLVLGASGSKSTTNRLDPNELISSDAANKICLDSKELPSAWKQTDSWGRQLLWGEYTLTNQS